VKLKFKDLNIGTGEVKLETEEGTIVKIGIKKLWWFAKLSATNPLEVRRMYGYPENFYHYDEDTGILEISRCFIEKYLKGDIYFETKEARSEY